MNAANKDRRPERDKQPALTIAQLARTKLAALEGFGFKVNKRVNRYVDSYMFGGGESLTFGVRYQGKRYVVSVQEVEE